MSERYFDALSRVAAAKDFTAECPMSFIDDVTKQVTKAMDEFILKQFERHGYSKEEITDLAIAGEVGSRERGSCTIYWVKGLALFEVERMTYDMTIPTEDYYALKNKLICRDLMPPVKSIEELED